VYRRVDANRIFASVYQNGKAVARGTIFMGGDTWRDGINYTNGHASGSNSLNESLTVEADDQTLYFKSLGMGFGGGDRDQKLSQEGAAETFWNMLISPLQGSEF
jgi:hypothetical protein